MSYISQGSKTLVVADGKQNVVTTCRGPLLDVMLPLTRGGGVATEPAA